MTNPPNIHWTHDAELLEQFVLHRLNEARRKEFEAHLLVCEECQRAVKDEQALVLGIKRVGRDEMKARLKERLAAAEMPPATRRVSWVPIASAAAVLIVVLGLGIYNKWLPFGTPEQEKVAEQPAETLKQVPEADQKQAASVEEAKAAPRVKEQAGRDETFAGREKETPRDLAAKQEERERDLRAAAPSAAGAAAKKDVTADALADKEAGEGQIAAERVWVDGVVLTEQRSADDLRQAMPSEQKRLQPRPETTSRMMQKANTTTVTVTEMPIEQLPATQQMRQQRLDRETVQTMIEQQDGNLNFNLYRQSGRQTPQQKLKTQSAQLEQVGSDSIIITIGNERIGYNIQGGLDALQQTKQTKTKK